MGIKQPHAGILVLSHHASIQQAYRALDAFFSSDTMIANELHYFHPQRLWQRY
jgi:hypothetical protein